MKKIFLNMGILVFLFGLMYIIGHNILYPVKSNNDIKYFSSKYDVDPYLVTSIVNSDFDLSPRIFKDLAKEMHVNNFNDDTTTESSFKVQCVSYLLSKYKSTENLDNSLERIINSNGSFNSQKLKSKIVSILRNKDWYKIFHQELS